MATDIDTLLAGLKRLVDALAFELVDLHAPKKTLKGDASVAQPGLQRPFMPKYVYLTNPLALDILPVDDKYEIVCVSDMSSARFWNYVQENLDLDEELVKPQNERLAIDVHHLKAFGLNTLGDAKVVLCYARYSADRFEGQIIRAPDLKGNLNQKLVPESNNGQEVNIAEAFDAQEINRQILNKHNTDTHEPPDVRQAFISSYLAVRKWALNSGLISSRFEMITEKWLFYTCVTNFANFDLRLLEGKDESEMAYSILNGEHFKYVAKTVVEDFVYCMEACVPAGAPSGLHIELSSNGEHMLQVLAQCSDPKQLEGLDGFLNSHKEFTLIHGLCWKSDLKAEFKDIVTEAVLAAPDGYVGRTWPYSFTDEAAGEASFLIAGYDHSGMQSWYVDALNDGREAMSFSSEILTQEEAREFVAEYKKLWATTESVATTQSSRFRTASAVMSRLRWDGTHAGTDYEVGYIDRFQDELMWKALNKWEKHTEEEEFIPEHRIMKVRRRRDEEVVWDRAKRVDKT